MIRIHPEDIKAIAREVVLLMSPASTQIEPVSPALLMIQLAREGRIEESKKIPKSLPKSWRAQ